MKAFSGFVVKEFFHIFRDRRTLLILFGMPIMQLMIFGYAVRNDIEHVKVAVVDQSRDTATEAIVDRMLASAFFDVQMGVRSEDVEGIFRRGEAKVAVVFPPSFNRDLMREGQADIQVLTDATEPNTASTVLAYVTGLVSDYQLEVARESGLLPGGLLSVEPRMRFNAEMRSVVLFVPGLMALILMLVCALMTSITITREKEVGTMEVLLVSPLRPTQIIVGKVMPYLALSLVNVATILVMARFVFGVPVRGSVVLLLAECLLFIICALSLGIFISTRTSSQQTAMMISLGGLLLPTVILSGFMFPVASMPVPLQNVSHIVPAKWFLIVIRGIMIKGVGLEVVWRETLILGGMTLMFLAASVRSFNVRLA
jgi:drug efflux transport system permease protein